MKNKSFVDCFMLMGTALSLRGGKSLPEMGRPLIQEISPTFINLSLKVEEFLILDVKSMVSTFQLNLSTIYFNYKIIHVIYISYFRYIKYLLLNLNRLNRLVTYFLHIRYTDQKVFCL